LNTSIYCFTRFYSRLHNSSMSHHIAISKIQTYKINNSFSSSGHRLLLIKGAHFRLQVICCHFESSLKCGFQWMVLLDLQKRRRLREDISVSAYGFVFSCFSKTSPKVSHCVFVIYYFDIFVCFIIVGQGYVIQVELMHILFMKVLLTTLRLIRDLYRFWN
jgi:hypothetical protein